MNWFEFCVTLVDIYDLLSVPILKRVECHPEIPYRICHEYVYMCRATHDLAPLHNADWQPSKLLRNLFSLSIILRVHATNSSHHSTYIYVCKMRISASSTKSNNPWYNSIATKPMLLRHIQRHRIISFSISSIFNYLSSNLSVLHLSQLHRFIDLRNAYSIAMNIFWAEVCAEYFH